MDRVGWLIDSDMFSEYRDELVAAIGAAGHVAKLVQAPQPPYRWDDTDCSYRKTFPADACVVTLGDIEFATRIQCENRWTPGAFCTVENYACSKYYCHFGQFILSQNYAMLPFGDLGRQRDFLFQTFGVEGKIFVRPDSPLKLFTGQLASWDRFAADIEYMGFYEFPPESLVVVSSPRIIVAEWRFIVVNRRVVAGSQYKRDGKLQLRVDYPLAAVEFAAKIASHGVEPDPVWILDVCQTDDQQLHLLEIGGFSFADLYLCDKRSIVDSVSQAAIASWRSSHGEHLASKPAT